MTILFTALGGIIFFDEFSPRRWEYYPISQETAAFAIRIGRHSSIHSTKVEAIGIVEPYCYFIGLFMIVTGAAAMIQRYDSY